MAGRATKLTFLEANFVPTLTRINRIYFNDRAYPFSEPNIDASVGDWRIVSRKVSSAQTSA